MILDVARVAGPFVVLAGVIVVYVSVRRLRIAMTALRLDCTRLGVEVAKVRRAGAGLVDVDQGDGPCDVVDRKRFSVSAGELQDGRP